MSTTISEDGLYDSASATPILIGSKCLRCDRKYFPPIGIGCENCGSDESALQRILLQASGVIHSVADVHRHHVEAVPFTVAEIVLDDGPLIRTLMHPESRTPRIGDRAVAKWRTAGVKGDGEPILEPAFFVVGGGGGA